MIASKFASDNRRQLSPWECVESEACVESQAGKSWLVNSLRADGVLWQIYISWWTHATRQGGPVTWCVCQYGHVTPRSTSCTLYTDRTEEISYMCRMRTCIYKSEQLRKTYKICAWKKYYLFLWYLWWHFCKKRKSKSTHKGSSWRNQAKAKRKKTKKANILSL